MYSKSVNQQSTRFVTGRKPKATNKSHENPASPVKNQNDKDLRSSLTDTQIDQTLDKLRSSVQDWHSSVQTTEVKKVRHFGIEISQNSVPSARFGNFMETSKHSSIHESNEHDIQAIDFKSPADSMTIARFGHDTSGVSSPPNQDYMVQERKDDSETVLHQSMEVTNINRVTVTTPLDEVDFMLSHSQI